MSGSVVNLLSSPPGVVAFPSSGATRSAATGRAGAIRKGNPPQHEFSLIPIASSFKRDLLHKAAQVHGVPSIKVTEARPRVILGRNMETKIEANFVSRQLVDIQFQSNTNAGQPPKILLKMLKGKNGAVQGHLVRLNGKRLDLDKDETCELKTGDIMALYDDQFKYKVNLGKPEIIELLNDDDDDDNEDKGTGAKAEGATAAGKSEMDSGKDAKKESLQPQSTSKEAQPSSPSFSARAREEVANDFLCPLCLEILTKAQTLSCGHAICGSCVADHGLDQFGASPQSSHTAGSSEEFHTAKEHHSESPPSSAQQSKSRQCPNCRKAITSIVPSIIVDNTVWNNVLQGTYFHIDDVKHFLLKSDRKLTEPQARHVFRKKKEYLSEYLLSLASSAAGDTERPKKKARSEAAAEDDTKPSAIDEPNDDDAKGDDDSVECIDVNVSNVNVSNNDVICID